MDYAKIKTSITKSRSGHYTLTLNYNKWPVYKAVKLNGVSRARSLADTAKFLIATKAYQTSTIQGEFVVDRLQRLQGEV